MDFANLADIQKLRIGADFQDGKIRINFERVRRAMLGAWFGRFLRLRRQYGRAIDERNSFASPVTR